MNTAAARAEVVELAFALRGMADVLEKATV